MGTSPVIVIMGVSGCGKSTLGAALAQALAVPFIEGDDHHPAANLAKMGAGTPLTEADRLPWIDAVVAACAELSDSCGEYCAVLACSALSSAVRERLSQGLHGATRLVYLHGDPALIRNRMKQRSGHFMPATLLDSQLAALQPPADAIDLDIAMPLEAQLQTLLAQLRAVAIVPSP